MGLTKALSKMFANFASRFKYQIFLGGCLLVHIIICLFSFYNHIEPLFYFNILSILIYTVCLFIGKRHEALTFYIGYIEILVHSFVAVLLVGVDFGFTLYFLFLVPMAFHLLYTTKTKGHMMIATLLSMGSLILFITCYLISINSHPVYTSDSLDFFKPYVYICNILITFVTLTVYSILFLFEAQSAYNKLYDQNQELDTLASTDPLTGLYNRRTMKSYLEKMYSTYKSEGKPFSLVIGDIDDFKKINDTYGHDCGDEVLKTISHSLSSLTRENDFLCRWGGEEFLIILNGIDGEKAKEIAERFRVQISNAEVKFKDLRLKMTMTFGVAATTETEQYKDLFQLADDRLYQGKHSGKNKVV